MKELLLILTLVSSTSLFAQNVGIGTTSPSEKLEVSGNVKASSFKYALPKTGFYPVVPAAFQKQYESDNIERYISGVFFATPTSNTMIAPIVLPQGATITGLKLYYFDNSDAADVRVSLNFYNFLGFVGPIATVTSSGSPGFGNVTNNTIGSPVVVNYSNGFYSVDAYATNGAWPGFELQIAAVIITYSMNETN